MAKIKEIWRQIPNYEGLYECSSKGRVKSIYRGRSSGRFLRPQEAINGYVHVRLCKNGIVKKFNVHRLVIMSFMEYDPNLVADHINRNRKDNRLCNLRQVTQRENMSNKSIKGTSKYVGVAWYKKLKKWRTQINIGGVVKHLGYFSDEITAADAYRLAVQQL